MEQEHFINKRLFFAFEILAPWPENLPSGRILDSQIRHMTLAFIGQADYRKLQKLLPIIPKPPFNIGLTGQFSAPLFLPKKHPRVVAWQIAWLDDSFFLLAYQKQLISWLQSNGFKPDVRHEIFLPHVTLSRAPFNSKEWEETFTPLPLILGDLHLYESLGHLNYQPCWSYLIKKPFQEIAHTADIAFCIRGDSLEQIYNHAQIALAFKFPALTPFFKPSDKITHLDEVVILLNEILSKADQEVGLPFKAVSFHGEIEEETDGSLKWEMIVDV
jgi:RNA 2',3'-cyclic 3'-phosphodiesterase